VATSNYYLCSFSFYLGAVLKRLEICVFLFMLIVRAWCWRQNMGKLAKNIYPARTIDRQATQFIGEYD
jgi:hypothetical protein